MSKRIISYRNWGIIGLIGEIIICFLLGSIFNNKSLPIFCIVILFQNTILGLLLYFLTNAFEKNQIEIKDVLGEDVSNSAIFGKVGLIHYDDNRNVMWISNLLELYHIDIINEKLLEWAPELEKTFEEEEVIQIEKNGYLFEVYNSLSSHTMYLKDITDYNGLNRKYNEERNIIGYLTLDNYDECIANIDETKVATIQSTMRNNITKWANDYNIMIRRFKSDAYILILNEGIYAQLVASKFNILNKIKQDANELGIIMTLSIGIGRQFDSIKENEEAAVNALNLAFSRGGDQVVVKSMNEQMKFFGGNTESNNTSSRVIARVKAKSLNGLISTASNVLIMGHKQSDLDSLGASIGVHKIVDSSGVTNHIVLSFESLEEKTHRVATMLKKQDDYKNVFITPKIALESIDARTLLILVDNHKESLAIEPELLHRIKNIVVIDHHRRSEEFISSTILTYLEPSASSCVELITELFDYQNSIIKLTEIEATVMFAGMLVDTNYFRTRVGVQTLQTASKLKALGTNMSLAYEFLEDDFEEVQLRISIMKKAFRYKKNIIIAYYDQGIVQSSLLAKVGNQLLDTAGIDAVFVVGQIAGEKVAISARSSKNINVQMIMESMGGGGHFGMAACQLKFTTVSAAVATLQAQIDDYLLEREEA